MFSIGMKLLWLLEFSCFLPGHKVETVYFVEVINFYSEFKHS